MKKEFKRIATNRQTEIVAKRRAIEQMMRYIDDTDSNYFVILDVTYNDTIQGGSYKPKNEIITARREVISHYLKIEALQYWREKNGSLHLNKDEYLELWELLKRNQYKKIGLLTFFKKLFLLYKI